MDNIDRYVSQSSVDAANTQRMTNIINTFMGSVIVTVILVLIFIVLWILLHPYKN